MDTSHSQIKSELVGTTIRFSTQSDIPELAILELSIPRQEKIVLREFALRGEINDDLSAISEDHLKWESIIPHTSAAPLLELVFSAKVPLWNPDGSGCDGQWFRLDVNLLGAGVSVFWFLFENSNLSDAIQIRNNLLNLAKEFKPF